MTDPASPSPPTAATSPEEAIKQYVAASHLHSQPTFDLLVLLTNEGTVSYISPSVTPLLGYAPAELIGRPATLFVHADDLETMQQVSPTRGQRAGRSLKANYRLRAKSGAQHMFEGSGLNLLHLPGIGAIAALFRRATQHELAPPVRWSDFSGPEHVVQFYETDAFLGDALHDFVGTSLGVGDACLVIATQAHRTALEERLHANHWGLAHAQGTYLAFDADETLSQCLADDGSISPERFTRVVGGIIAEAAQGHRHVRIFGEMVNLLWERGRQAEAMHLETLWNSLAHTTAPFTLFCAYAIQGFAGEANRAPFSTICQSHSVVLPDESYSTLTSPDERLRAITLLQQQASTLRAEHSGRQAAD